MSSTNNQSSIDNYFTIIQNVITRMAQNGFLLKAWTVTIVSGISILTFSFINIIILSILLIIIILFWILDSYYLRLERLYRKLYENNVYLFTDTAQRSSIRLYDTDYEKYNTEIKKTYLIIFTKTEVLFYLPFAIAISILLILSLISQ